jgi:hypothetical protein
VPGRREPSRPRIDGQPQPLERLHAEDRLGDVTDEERCWRLSPADPKDCGTGIELGPPPVGERDGTERRSRFMPTARASASEITEYVSPVSTSMRTVTVLSADSFTR